mmetsp:Transcript_35854/g.60426  ORF Transcript_35854/g.60426 Transcript_35854/m.60426 type:complete len:333 (-) Transcript_35854:566-1564(-)
MVHAEPVGGHIDRTELAHTEGGGEVGRVEPSAQRHRLVGVHVPVGRAAAKDHSERVENGGNTSPPSEHLHTLNLSQVHTRLVEEVLQGLDHPRDAGDDHLRELLPCDGAAEVHTVVKALHGHGREVVRAQDLLRLLALLPQLGHRLGVLADVVSLHLFLVELIREVFDKDHIQVGCADGFVPGDRLHLELPEVLHLAELLALEGAELHEGSHRAAGTEIVEDHFLSVIHKFFINSILQSCSCVLANQRQHVEAGEIRRLEQHRALALSKERRHRDHHVPDVTLAVRLSDLLHVMQNHRYQILHAVEIPFLGLVHDRLALRILHQLVGEVVLL